MTEEKKEYIDRIDYAAYQALEMQKARDAAKAAHTGETADDGNIESQAAKTATAAKQVVNASAPVQTANEEKALTPEVEQIYKARPSVPVPAADVGGSIPPEGVKKLIDAVLRSGH